MRVVFSAARRKNVGLYRRLRWDLLRAGFRVGIAAPDDRPPRADVWWVSPFDETRTPLGEREADRLRSFPGRIIDFCRHDAIVPKAELYPADLRERIDGWALTAWCPEAPLPVPPARMRLLPPFLPKTVRFGVDRPLPWPDRANVIFFLGAFTGNQDPGTNVRIAAVRALRRSGLPFRGGLFVNSDVPDQALPGDVRAPRLRPFDHLRTLRQVTISLCLPGFNPVTYRLMESLATGALCVSPPLRRYRWLDGGLAPGEHYVEVAETLDDLGDVVEHYLSHPAEAQAIAAAGHRRFREFFLPRGLCHHPAMVRAFLDQMPELPSPEHANVGVTALDGLVTAATRLRGRWRRGRGRSLIDGEAPGTPPG